MATISERIKKGLQIRNMKQADLVALTGIGKSSISTYISGEYEPKQRNIYKIAKALNVNEAWLMGVDCDMARTSIANNLPAAHGVKIPVLGRVSAGIPLTASEYIVDTEEIPAAMAADGEYFGLMIKGDSMEPKISNGDVVIVRKQEDADDGDVVIALVNGDDAVCKRLKKYSDGISLISNNPAYEPMYFTNSEITEKPVQIIGKVKELRAKF